MQPVHSCNCNHATLGLVTFPSRSAMRLVLSSSSCAAAAGARSGEPKANTVARPPQSFIKSRRDTPLRSRLSRKVSPCQLPPKFIRTRPIISGDLDFGLHAPKSPLVEAYQPRPSLWVEFGRSTTPKCSHPACYFLPFSTPHHAPRDTRDDAQAHTVSTPG